MQGLKLAARLMASGLDSDPPLSTSDFMETQKTSKNGEDGSVGITEESLIRKFTDQPDFPYLVSFPRTGSHWLRMLMELYFEKPSLVRSFYYKESKDFTCYHWHDEDLKLRRRNVLYLYRNPVPTIYSQLMYYREDPDDVARIQYWSGLYAQHLQKWLITDNFTTRKTVLAYEGLQKDLVAEFQKVCHHLDQVFDAGKLELAAAQVTKENLKKKTRHDSQVVNLSNSYAAQRERFEQRHACLVMDNVLSRDAGLQSVFP